MGLFEIACIGIGLAMDAFAVSVCKGLSMKKFNFKKASIIAAYFGVFQAIMPLTGYLLGSTFQELVANIDHWIAFILLSVIGGEMIKSSYNKEKEDYNDNIDVKTMLVLSIATSIDALAVGVTFAFLNTKIIPAILVIGVVTFILSLLGVKVGKKFGDEFQNKAELLGGVILIIIGLKILTEHLHIFPFN